jgi:NADH-quinone oxidoreductase subunit N
LVVLAGCAADAWLSSVSSTVLKAAYDAGLGWFAVAGVVASVIGAFSIICARSSSCTWSEQDVQLDRNDRLFCGGSCGICRRDILGVVNLFELNRLPKPRRWLLSIKP